MSPLTSARQQNPGRGGLESPLLCGCDCVYLWLVHRLQGFRKPHSAFPPRPWSRPRPRAPPGWGTSDSPVGVGPLGLRQPSLLLREGRGQHVHPHGPRERKNDSFPASLTRHRACEGGDSSTVLFPFIGVFLPLTSDTPTLQCGLQKPASLRRESTDRLVGFRLAQHIGLSPESKSSELLASGGRLGSLLTSGQCGGCLPASQGRSRDSRGKKCGG